jgi:hypothetical protein
VAASLATREGDPKERVYQHWKQSVYLPIDMLDELRAEAHRRRRMRRSGGTFVR